MKSPVSCLRIIAFLSLPMVASSASAQTPAKRHRDKPADAAELTSITERGRAIAAYDQVAWHATDTVQELHPPKDAVSMYIGRHTDTGWVVAFGKLNETRDVFLLAYEADPKNDVLHPHVTINTPAEEDRGEWLNEARAYDAARAALGTVQGPYNGTVLAGPNSSWYVYFYPAQTKNDVFPTGADTRFQVAHDGRTILETHKMHVSLIQNQQPKDGTKTEMSFHTAILDDAPEDTDVADVLMMGGVPMLIAGEKFTYRIAADGTASFVATTKAFLKGAK